MGSQVNPCITFDGNAREAMEFYQQVFGGTLEVSTVADFGSPASPNADKVMHSRLDTAAGYTLMAWDFPVDRPGHPPHRPGNNVAVFLGGDDGELRDYFEKLSVGGTVTLPLDTQVWGDEAGSLVDRFGISWMFNITARHR
ncbi:VOC family protein [Nocardia cyriacigeorgica]|uniref:VOC family protein n=1 Tax=Nocardia cyriacigeorgica TaxID=135487 RepID=A0A5R8NPM8_9NOCA|nr:VOC family protein [Nocardia cyriacigeorgica]TLF77581.1 VOC family protein [Nocardia cyriacigeorgica]